MRRTSLLLLFIAIASLLLMIILSGCGKNPKASKPVAYEESMIYENVDRLKIATIDSCEYIVYVGHTIIHKYNCKNHRLTSANFDFFSGSTTLNNK